MSTTAARRLLYGPDAQVALLEVSWHDPSRIDDEMRAGYAAPQAVRDWERGLWELVRAPGTFTVADRPDDVGVPVLLVTGVS
jgi:hypothetical protein